MSEQPSLSMMCEVFLAEIDNGLDGGFDVEHLPIPYAIQKHFEETNIPYDQLSFVEIVELVEKIQEEEALKRRGLDSGNKPERIEKPQIQEKPCTRAPLEMVRKTKFSGWMEYWYGSGDVQEIKEEVEDLQYSKEEKKF